MASLAPFLKQRFDDSNGNPLAGGKLYSYAAGTSTPLATYTDSTGGTPNANPVVLDANGEASVWLGTSSYKFVLKDSNDVTQWTVDQVSLFGEAPTSLYRWAGTAGGTTNALLLTPSPTLTAYSVGQTFAFIAAFTNSGAATVNISSLGVKDIKSQGGTALVAGEITAGALYTLTYDGTNFVLNDGNVITAKIVDAMVTAAKLATDSVTTAKILADNVTLAKLEAFARNAINVFNFNRYT